MFSLNDETLRTETHSAVIAKTFPAQDVSLLTANLACHILARKAEIADVISARLDISLKPIFIGVWHTAAFNLRKTPVQRFWSFSLEILKFN